MKRTYTSLPFTEYPTTAFDANRATIDRVVLHSTAGTLQAALNTFSSPNATTSAHYIIDNDGKIWAGLEEYNVSYANGNYPMNQRSVTIEHVDEGASVKRHTDAQYAMSAKLVKDICTFYNIPIDSSHIIPHSSVVATACPNGLDVNRIIREASGSSPVVDDCPAKLAEKIKQETFLNGEIEKKDDQITKMASDATLLQSQYNTLALKEQECQKQALIYKEAYDALPSIKEQLAHLEENKIKQAGEISELTKQVGYWQTKYGNLKKPGLKFIQAAVIGLCEKLGVQV